MVATKPKPVRILQVISSSATSGAEKHVLQLSRILIEDGHYVEIICPPGGWLGEQCRRLQIPVTESPMKGRDWFSTAGLVLRHLKERKIDLVHSHLTRATYFGAIGGLLRSVPCVATVHIANHDQIYKRMALRANRLVAVSNFVRGMLHGRGIPDRYIDTVYNGTDFTEYAPADPVSVRDEFRIPSDRRLIGLVGRVCREKGHLLMIDALRDIIQAHPQTHMLFVGRIESHFQEEFTDALESSGISKNVTLTGVRHDVPRLLDSLEFTTMPSHQETFGIAAIEAMARSRPVVASRIGGLMEVVRHQQTGLLVDLRPDAIAEAVDFLLLNQRERESMGVLGRAIVEEKFTLRAMVDRLERVYQLALS